MRAPLRMALPLPELDFDAGAVPMDLHVDANVLFHDDRLAKLDDAAMSVVRGDSSGVFVEVGADEASAAFAIATDAAIASRSKVPAKDRSGSGLQVTGDSRDER